MPFLTRGLIRGVSPIRFAHVKRIIFLANQGGCKDSSMQSALREVFPLQDLVHAASAIPSSAERPLKPRLLMQHPNRSRRITIVSCSATSISLHALDVCDPSTISFVQVFRVTTTVMVAWQKHLLDLW